MSRDLELLKQTLYGVQVQLGVAIQMIEVVLGDGSGPEADTKTPSDQTQPRGPRYFNSSVDPGEASELTPEDIRARMGK